MVGSEALPGFSTNGPDWANNFLALLRATEIQVGRKRRCFLRYKTKGHQAILLKNTKAFSVNGGSVQSSQGAGMSQGGVQAL